MNLYTGSYDHTDQRPSTSPQPVDGHWSFASTAWRAWFNCHLLIPTNFNTSQAEFTYSAAAMGHTMSIDSMNDGRGWVTEMFGPPNWLPLFLLLHICYRRKRIRHLFQKTIMGKLTLIDVSTRLSLIIIIGFSLFFMLIVFCTDSFAGPCVCSNEQAPCTPLQQSPWGAIEFAPVVLPWVALSAHAKDSWIYIPLSFVCGVRCHLLCFSFTLGLVRNLCIDGGYDFEIYITFLFGTTK